MSICITTECGALLHISSRTQMILPCHPRIHPSPTLHFPGNIWRCVGRDGEPFQPFNQGRLCGAFLLICLFEREKKANFPRRVKIKIHPHSPSPPCPAVSCVAGLEGATHVHTKKDHTITSAETIWAYACMYFIKGLDM